MAPAFSKNVIKEETPQYFSIQQSILIIYKDTAAHFTTLLVFRYLSF